MAKLFDRVGQSTATTGQASPITLGAYIQDATNGDYAAFSDMGAVAGDSVNYLIVDGRNWEIGVGTLAGTGPGFTLTRVVSKSSIAGVVGTTLLTLSGTAKVFSVPANLVANTWAQTPVFMQGATGLASSEMFNGATLKTGGGALFADGYFFGVGQTNSVRFLIESGVQRKIVLENGMRFGWSSNSGSPDAGTFRDAMDLALGRDAANILAQRLGTGAQTLRIYGSTDNDSGAPTANYSRLSIKHAGGTAGATIATEAGGAGTGGPLTITTSGLAGASPKSFTFGTDGSFSVGVSSIKNTSTVNGVVLDLNSTGAAPYTTDFILGGVTFRIAKDNQVGTGDVFFQTLALSTGWGVLEAWSGQGLVLGTGSAANPIAFRINRVEVMRLNGAGQLAFGLIGSAQQDVAIGRSASGMLEVNDGTSGNVRDLKVRNITITGSQTGGSAGGGASADPYLQSNLYGGM